MQHMREASRVLGGRMADYPHPQRETDLSMLSLSRERDTMGSYPSPTQVNLEGISRAEPPDRCEVCGRATDVAQIITTMSGPEPDSGGYANMVFICTYCLARGIQAVTGFKAVKTLHSWYQVREAHSGLKPAHVHKVPDMGESIG